VSLWLDARRTTQVVDLIGIKGLPEERYKLMGLAQDLGLSIETVNSAADYFVRQIPGWQDEIVVFLEGEKGVVYRPTPTLFLLLKAKRLSPQDLEDCRAAVREAAEQQLEIDATRVADYIGALPPAANPDQERRREALLALLDSKPPAD